jgi:hypothetical protein
MHSWIVDLLTLIPFGFLIGFLLHVSGVLLGEFPEERAGRGAAPPHSESADKQGFRGWLRSTAHLAREQAEEGRGAFAEAPRSAKIVVAVLYGLVGLVVLLVKLTAVHMIWYVFVAGILGGFFVGQIRFERARSRRPDPSSFKPKP